jgi:O-antigen ligase
VAKKAGGTHENSLMFYHSSLFLSFFLLPVFLSVTLISLFADFLPVCFGNFADQRFFLVFLLVFVTFYVSFIPARRSRRRLWVDNWPAFVVAVGFLVLAVPFVASKYRWVEPGMYGFFFMAFSVLGWGIRERQCTERAAFALVTVILVGCFFYAAMTLTAYAFAITDEFSNFVDVIPWGFVNMRYWGHLATWFLPLFPLALLYGSLKNRSLWRAGVYLTGGVWWWVVLLTTSRGSMVSLVLAVVIVLVLFGRMAMPWLAVSFRFALLGGLLWCVLSWAIPELVFDKAMIRGLHSGASGRLPLWMEAWEMSLQNFPLGMGAQSWLTHTTLTSNYLAAQTLGHPHNMYLMWAAEYGWALIGLVALLLSVMLKRLISLRRLMVSGMPGHASLIIAFTASSAAGFAHAGVSAVFLVPATMSVALLVLAIFWALSLPVVMTDSGLKAISGEFKCWLRPCVLLAPFILFLGILWMQEVWRYHEAMREDLKIYVEGPSAPLLPRFWLHGFFPRPVPSRVGPDFAK